MCVPSIRALGRGTDILSTSIRAPLAIASINRKSEHDDYKHNGVRVGMGRKKVIQCQIDEWIDNNHAMTPSIARMMYDDNESDYLLPSLMD